MGSDVWKCKAVWFAVIVLGVGVLMFGCGGGEEGQESSETVEVLLVKPKVGVGDVKFGMTADEVKRV